MRVSLSRPNCLLGSTIMLTGFFVMFLQFCLAARWACGFALRPWLSAAILPLSDAGILVFMILFVNQSRLEPYRPVITLFIIAQSIALFASLLYCLSVFYGFSSRYNFAIWFRIFRLHANTLWAAATAIVYFKLQSGRIHLIAALLLTSYLILCIICDGAEQYLMPVTAAFPDLTAFHNAVYWWTEFYSPDASGMAEMVHYTLRIMLTCFFVGSFGFSRVKMISIVHTN